MKFMVILLVTLVFSGCSNQDHNYVVVKGAATIQVPIDYMKIGVYIENSSKTVEQANKENKELVVQMFKALTSFGIADSDFVTDRSEMATDWAYDALNSREELLKIVYSGTLTLRDPGIYDKLFWKLSSLNKVKVQVKGYGSNRLLEYKQEAYSRALQNASKQADLLLSGTHQKKGQLLRVLQEGIDPYHMYDDFEDQISDASRIQSSSRPTLAIESEDMELAVVETWRKTTYSISSGAIVIYEIVD